MKQLTFNTSSWHYMLATKVAHYQPPYTYLGNAYEGTGEDICVYTRYVLGAMLLLTIYAGFIALAGFALSHMILGIIFSCIYGMWMFSPIGEAVLLLTCVFGITFGVVSLTSKISKYRSAKRRAAWACNASNEPDSFVTHAYKSWKEKFCVKINFVDPNEKENDFGGQGGGA